MTWLITGGSGQLSTALSLLLEKQGKSFISLSREELDVSNPDSIKALISMKPDVIINCAAWTDVEKAELNFEKARNVNEKGAINMAKAAKLLDVRLIHISTDYVFSGQKNTPWKNGEEGNPSSKYGLSKLLGEKGILNVYREGSIILRTAWLYGPHGKNFVKAMIRKAIHSSEAVKVVNDQIGQPTSTDDLSAQILKVEETGIVDRILHATNSGTASWFEFASEIFRMCGQPTSRVRPGQSSEFETLAKRPSYSVLDHSDWLKLGIPAMRPWKDALTDAFPGIRVEIEKEVSCG